jgi:hypothetical protein
MFPNTYLDPRATMRIKIDGQLLGGNPNDDHEDFEIKTLERGNLVQE